MKPTIEGEPQEEPLRKRREEGDWIFTDLFDQEGKLKKIVAQEKDKPGTTEFEVDETKGEVNSISVKDKEGRILSFENLKALRDMGMDEPKISKFLSASRQILEKAKERLEKSKKSAIPNL